jgi:hypothetical protein
MTQDFILSGDEMVLDGGDFDISTSNNQHIEHIIKSNKGNFYQWPLLGYGIATKIKATFDNQTEKANIRKQLESDNMNIEILEIYSNGDDFNIEIEASRS